MSKASKAWYEVYEFAIVSFERDTKDHQLGLDQNYIMGKRGLPSSQKDKTGRVENYKVTIVVLYKDLSLLLRFYAVSMLVENIGKALYNLKKADVFIRLLKTYYCYTNDESTGILHALMDTTENYTSSSEALFMLVACSYFINYLEMNEK